MQKAADLVHPLRATADVASDPYGIAVSPRGEILLSSAWGHTGTSLSAGGLLPDPSVFTPAPRQMEKAPTEPRDVLRLGSMSAPSFGEQLKLAAQRFRPVAVNFHASRVPVETPHNS